MLQRQRYAPGGVSGAGVTSDGREGRLLSPPPGGVEVTSVARTSLTRDARSPRFGPRCDRSVAAPDPGKDKPTSSGTCSTESVGSVNQEGPR